jgi:excisionase family DNA binding protein
MGEQVLTVSEVAEDLRCGTSSVYRMVASGQLRSFRVGVHGVRITRSALEAFKAGEAPQQVAS